MIEPPDHLTKEIQTGSVDSLWSKLERWFKFDGRYKYTVGNWTVFFTGPDWVRPNKLYKIEYQKEKNDKERTEGHDR